MKQLGDKQWGPFKIVKKVGASSYKLDIPKTWKWIHPIFNKNLLTPYHEPEFPTQPQNTWPPPVEVEGAEPEFVVEEIVDSKKVQGGAVRYKVKWEGYGPHEMTWEPITVLDNAKDAIKDFHNKFPNKPKTKEIWKIEIPMAMFPKELFHQIPEPLTEPILESEPTEMLALKCAQSGIQALKRGWCYEPIFLSFSFFSICPYISVLFLSFNLLLRIWCLVSSEDLVLSQHILVYFHFGLFNLIQSLLWQFSDLMILSHAMHDLQLIIQSFVSSSSCSSLLLCSSLVPSVSRFITSFIIILFIITYIISYTAYRVQSLGPRSIYT